MRWLTKVDRSNGEQFTYMHTALKIKLLIIIKDEL